MDNFRWSFPPLPPNDHRLLSVNPSGWSSGELVFAQVSKVDANGLKPGVNERNSRI